MPPPISPAPTIVLMIVVANCVHLLVGLQQRLRAGDSKHDAIVESVRLNLHPVFLASLTTALGFLSMNFSEVPPYRHLGNFVAFGIAEVGMAYAMSQRPAATLQAMRRAKVWSPEGDISVARALDTFGIAPIPLTVVDVLPGLQTGLIDTVASPPVAAVALQWHTQLDYVLDIPLMYVYGLLAVSDRRFRGLSDADAAAVRRILADAVAEADRRNRGDHDATMQVLISQGLKLETPAPDELANWRRLGKQAEVRWVREGIISDGLYRQLVAALAAARGTAATVTAPDASSSVARGRPGAPARRIGRASRR